MENQYFEGILQLRDPNKEIIEFINKKIKENNNVFISKEVKQKDGVDLYISSRKFLKNLAYKLHKQFGGELKINPRIYSRNKQTSKNIYRINVLYRYPRFKKGQIINYKGDTLKILIVDKKIYTQDLKTGKKKWLDYRNLKTSLIGIVL